jgi:hypothetical protein
MDSAHRQYLTASLPAQCCARNCNSASLKAAGFCWVMRCVAWGMTTKRLPGMHRTSTSLPKADCRRECSPPTTRVGILTPRSVAREIAGGRGDERWSGTVRALSRIIWRNASGCVSKAPVPRLFPHSKNNLAAWIASPACAVVRINASAWRSSSSRGRPPSQNFAPARCSGWHVDHFLVHLASRRLVSAGDDGSA